MSADDKIREQLSAYLDNELPDEQSRQLDQAILGDPALGAELKRLQAVRALISKLPRASAPAHVAEKALARAERARLLAGMGRRPARPASWWISRLATAALVLLAVGLGSAVLVWVNSPSYVNDKPGYIGPSRDFTLAHRRGAAPLDRDGLAPAKAADLGDALAGSPGVTSFFINTDNLPQVQREVEALLESNCIQVVEDAGQPADAGGGIQPPPVPKARPSEPDQPARSKVNGSGVPGDLTTQVRYEVVMDEKHMQPVLEALNGLRSAQKVTQDNGEVDLALRQGTGSPPAPSKVASSGRQFKPAAGYDAAPLPRPTTRPAGAGSEQQNSAYAQGSPAAGATTQPAKGHFAKEMSAVDGWRGHTDEPTTQPAQLALRQAPDNRALRIRSNVANQSQLALDARNQRYLQQTSQAVGNRDNQVLQPSPPASGQQRGAASNTLATTNVKQLVIILNDVTARE